MEEGSQYLDDETLEFLSDLQDHARRVRLQQSAESKQRLAVPGGARNRRAHNALRMDVVDFDPALAAAQEPLPSNTPSLPDKQYRVIYSDPPWRGHFGESYETLSDEQLALLDVRSLNHPDGTVHFMWVVGSKVDDAIALLKIWGYEFRDYSFVWVKTTKHPNEDGIPRMFMGQGATVRHNTEVCIEAHSKHRPMSVDNEDVMQVVIAPLDDDHSSKPAEVRKRIVELYSAEPRIELFARNRFVGWDVWGLGVEEGAIPIPQQTNAQPARIINLVPPNTSNSWWVGRKWYTTAEAAEHISQMGGTPIGAHRVIDFIKQGRLDGQKVGNQWLVGRRSVMKFAEVPRKNGRPFSGQSPVKKKQRKSK